MLEHIFAPLSQHRRESFPRLVLIPPPEGTLLKAPCKKGKLISNEAVKETHVTLLSCCQIIREDRPVLNICCTSQIVQDILLRYVLSFVVLASHPEWLMAHSPQSLGPIRPLTAKRSSRAEILLHIAICTDNRLPIDSESISPA